MHACDLASHPPSQPAEPAGVLTCKREHLQVPDQQTEANARCTRLSPPEDHDPEVGEPTHNHQDEKAPTP